MREERELCIIIHILLKYIDIYSLSFLKLSLHLYNISTQFPIYTQLHFQPLINVKEIIGDYSGDSIGE